MTDVLTARTPRSGRSGSTSPRPISTTWPTGWPAPAGPTSSRPRSAGTLSRPGPVPPGWEYGVPLDYVKNLVEYWQTGYHWRAMGSEAELLPAVHHHYRRADHLLPARPLPRARRHAADPHPRLAQHRGGVPRTHRSAHRPARSRRGPGRLLRRRHPVPSGVRLLRTDHRGGMGRAVAPRRRGPS